MSVTPLRPDLTAPSLAYATDVPVPKGLPRYDDVVAELLEMLEVLQGHEPLPLDGAGRPLVLQEVATAYHTRARYLEARILLWESRARLDSTARRCPEHWSKLRTGPIGSVLSALRHVMDMGSRRLSELQYLQAERGDAGPGY